MIPGAYAFRAGIGGLRSVDASLVLIGETIGLAITAMLMTVAIAVGLSLALATPFVTSTAIKRPDRNCSIVRSRVDLRLVQGHSLNSCRMRARKGGIVDAALAPSPRPSRSCSDAFLFARSKANSSAIAGRSRNNGAKPSCVIS